MATSDKAPKDPAAAREAKLGQALRANLRRRKAQTGPKAVEPKNKAGDDG